MSDEKKSNTTCWEDPEVIKEALSEQLAARAQEQRENATRIKSLEDALREIANAPVEHSGSDAALASAGEGVGA